MVRKCGKCGAQVEFDTDIPGVPDLCDVCDVAREVSRRRVSALARRLGVKIAFINEPVEAPPLLFYAED